MIRNLKALGLAFVAVFAMSAIAASAAQATHFGWESGATTLEFEADPDIVEGVNEGSQLFTTTASNLTCNEITGKVTLPGGTTAEELETENLKYDNNESGKCVGTGGLEPKVEMNGCDYVFHAGATVAGGTEVTADIVCPGGGIKINAGFLCTVTVPAQKGLGGITATNRQTPGEKEEVTLEATTEKIKYSHTGLCGNGSAENGVYHGKVTIFAHNNATAPRHVTVT